jgi:hypothetical protein
MSLPGFNELFILAVAVILIISYGIFISLAIVLNLTDYLSTICFPKGISEISINLKCCLAKGMPMMVSKSKIPKAIWPIASHKPPQRIQMIFRRRGRQPLAEEVLTAMRPKGQSTKPASLKH